MKMHKPELVERHLTEVDWDKVWLWELLDINCNIIMPPVFREIKMNLKFRERNWKL